MSEPYLAEIKIVGFNFAPRGYAQCDGQLLPISQNQALYSLLGTTYGGDGRTTFALPELRGRVPVHVGGGITLGGKSGAENVSLNTNEMPSHNHSLSASNQAETLGTPVGSYLPTHSSIPSYAPPSAANGTMVSNEVSNMGGSQSHNNMQPYTVINIIIALQGIFPPRN